MTDFQIPIHVVEYAGLKREREPVRIGVPLSKGFVENVHQICVTDPLGRFQPLQARPLSFWADRSVKWVLLDFFVSVPENGETIYTVVRDNGRETAARKSEERIKISEHKDRFVIDTGAIQFVASRKQIGPLLSVQLGTGELLSATGSDRELRDNQGTVCPQRIHDSVIDESGGFRRTVRQSGRFMLSRKTFVEFKTDLTFFAGLSIVQIDFQIHNPKAALHPGGLWDLGDSNSILFKDLSLNLFMSEGIQQIELCAEKEKPLIARKTTGLIIYQDSSGGDQWDSPNHKDYTGHLSVSFPGYRIYGDDDKIIEEGKRATPYIKIDTSKGWIAGTVQDFWQNFPKALRVNEKKMSLAIFPFEAKSDFELQGGEKKRHTLYLEFGPSEKSTTLEAIHSPLHVYPDPKWIETSRAISYFIPEQDDTNENYLTYIKNVIRGPNSFFRKQEAIDEYGWRNFGDLYADHEAVHYNGSSQFISHYNNQYDFIYGAFVHFLRSGNRSWFKLMRDGARHHMDIDIYHTDDDKQSYNHGLFWHTDHYRDAATCTHRTYSRKTLKELASTAYGGGPANEHNYTSGLLHYYYLSGDEEAKEAVLELAGWVIDMDDGKKNILGLIDEGPTGLASQTVSSDYHKPARGAGNSINALLDAYRLTLSRRYLNKAEELLLRCIHPSDDIDELHLSEPEYRWSYLVFLQITGKYLDFKNEIGEIDYTYYYARDSLLHYTDWMAENEMPYKDILNKVDIPTETWPAQDVRKAHIFYLACKYGEPEKRLLYTEKAEFFFKRCLEDVLSFKTAYVTRPLVILSVYGFIPAFFQNNADSSKFMNHGYDFALPVKFLPQKARLKAALKNKLDMVFKTITRVASSKYHGLQFRNDRQ